MAINKRTANEKQWQTFSVIDGVIARDEAGQIEMLLKLADDVTLVFMAGVEGVHQMWLPSEPDLAPAGRPKRAEPQVPARKAGQALRAA